MSMKTLLGEAIEGGIESLGDKELGSDEYQKSVNELTKLIDRAIELEKIDVEQQKSEKELELNMQQAKDEKKDRLIRNSISVAGVVLPILVTIWGTKVSLKFEETGTVTTIMGRGFINKLLPKK